MMDKPQEHCDYNIRQWTIDSAINLNKKGAKADKIIKDASKFYGYLFPNNGKIEVLKTGSK